MKRISICALKKDRKAMLEELQRKEVLEISNTKSKQKVFYKEETTKKTDILRKKIQTVQNALEILNRYSPEKKPLLSMLEGRKEVDLEQYDSFALQKKEVYEKAVKVVELSKKIVDQKIEQQKLDLQIAALEPWKELDIPLSETATRMTKVFIGSLPEAWEKDQIAILLEEYGPVDVHIISVQEEFTCISVMATKKQAELVFEALRQKGFARPALSCDLAPKDQLNEYEREKKILDSKMKEEIEKIKNLASSRQDFLFFIDYETMRTSRFENVQNLLQSKHTFILTGFIVAQNAEALKQLIESHYVAYVEIMEPSKKDDVPVVFKNNGFSGPLESVTAGFGAPSRNEMDPTFTMSLFYYMLFGIMFSDAGYGLILAIVCGIILLKYKRMELGMRKFIKMFFFCGVATAFWGFLFGSFFGDAVGIVAKSFFNSDVTLKPLWFSPNDDPMKMLVFAMLLGLLHLLSGLVMKFINCIKNKQYKDAIYDSVFWFALVVSCVILLMSVQMFVDILGISDMKLSGEAGKVASIVAIISVIGIVLTSGRESKNWFKRILKGIYGVYGITGYLSDVLSYSRLLALGLATGVIASVVNSMSVMSENIIVRIITFTIIFLIGHVLNFLINILGAYVHTNRLQYVEFYGKFYDGGGRLFKPFSSKTKYFIIKENEHE